MKNLILFLGLWIGISTSIFAQSDCILVCNINVVRTLDESGNLTLTPLDILEENNVDPDCAPFYQIGLEDGLGNVIFNYDTQLLLDCDDAGEYLAIIYVVDNGIIYNTCWSNILIEPNPIACTYEIAPGTFPLRTLGNNSRDYASKVYLNGAELNKVVSGLYEVPKASILAGENEITFESNNAFLSGISTLDLVYISKWITEEDTPPQDQFLVAGDFDLSNYIGVNDLVQLREHILGITPGSSFRFLHTGIDYSGIDVFDFGMDMYTFKFTDMDTSSIVFDFDVVVGGDVNNNYFFKAETPSEVRNAKAKLIYSDQKLEQGQSYLINFTLEDETMINGLQTAFDIHEFESFSILSDYTDEELKYNIIGDEFRISFLSEPVEKFTVTLQLSPRKSGNLSDLLSLSTKFVHEVVTSSIDASGIELVASTISGTTESNEIAFTIAPNPLLDYAQITMPVADNYSVEISDIRGNVIGRDSFYGHTFLIGGDRFATTGLYIVRVSSSSSESVSKLTVVK